MIIKLILVSILLVALLFAMLRKEKAPLISLSMMLLAGVGITLVVFPSIAQSLADIVGVSRGVDLVIYVFMAVMMAVLLDLYLRWQSTMDTLTSIVRHISLNEVKLPPNKDS